MVWPTIHAGGRARAVERRSQTADNCSEPTAPWGAPAARGSRRRRPAAAAPAATVGLTAAGRSRRRKRRCGWPGRDGAPRHLRVRALPRTRDHPRDALPVRRAAGPGARARREGPRSVKRRALDRDRTRADHAIVARVTGDVAAQGRFAQHRGSAPPGDPAPGPGRDGRRQAATGVHLDASGAGRGRRKPAGSVIAERGASCPSSRARPRQPPLLSHARALAP